MTPWEARNQLKEIQQLLWRLQSQLDDELDNLDAGTGDPWPAIRKLGTDLLELSEDYQRIMRRI